MRIASTKPLFAWECLDDSPTLATLKEFLAAIPDGPLLESLRRGRGKGRDDYPVHVLWGVELLTVALRHPTTEACLAELRRNAGLRRLIGITSEDQVPKKWNLSRFQEVLGQEPHRTQVKAIFNAMIQRLGEVVPDLGRDTAGDATHLNARRKAEAAAKQEAAEGLPQASGGRKEYTDNDGKVTEVVEWFGFKLHLLVDVKHEVSLSYEITDTKAGDGETLPSILTQAQQNLPPKRIKTVAYDKAADTNDVHELLSAAGIKAVIHNRKLWKQDPERMLPGHDGNSNIVYDESGTVYCYDRVSEPIVRHPMAYIGHEPERQTLKYRCPARHEGWECPMSKICNAGKSYGLTVRVPREIDLRRFPELPRATKKFERLYKGRTAVERVNVEEAYSARDPNYGMPAAKTFARELKRRFSAAVAASRADAPAIMSPPVVAQPTRAGLFDFEAEVANAEATGGASVDPPEDVLAMHQKAAITRVAGDKVFIDKIWASGIAWAGIVDALERALPNVLDDRNKIAYDLVPQFLIETFGERGKGWDSEKRQKKSGPRTTTWVVLK